MHLEATPEPQTPRSEGVAWAIARATEQAGVSDRHLLLVCPPVHLQTLTSTVQPHALYPEDAITPRRNVAGTRARTQWLAEDHRWSPAYCGTVREAPQSEVPQLSSHSVRCETWSLGPFLFSPSQNSGSGILGGVGGPRDALEGEGPQRRVQKLLNRRLEEVAKVVGGGHCRLQMLLSLALLFC